MFKAQLLHLIGQAGTHGYNASRLLSKGKLNE
jgi:hypothetical protein